MEKAARFAGCFILVVIIGGVLVSSGQPGALITTATLRPLKDLQIFDQGPAKPPNVTLPLSPSAGHVDAVVLQVGNATGQPLIKNRTRTPTGALQPSGPGAMQPSGPPRPATAGELGPNMTRMVVVCQYTPTPELCNGSHTQHNVYLGGGAHSTTRESPTDPAVLLTAYRQEPGLRQLMDLFERTHLPDVAGCQLRGKEPPGQAAPAGGRLCVMPDSLNPFVLEEDFRAFQDAGPFFQPPARLMKQWFRYQVHPILLEYETDNWLFGRRHIHFDDAKLANRSLVYWHLEGRDLRTLRRRISELTHHIFIICNSLDEPEFQDWLLDNPFILKVFSVNVPSTKASHPKLFPIPLGIRYTTADVVQQGRTLKRRIPPRDLLLASFTVGHGTMRAKRRGRVLQVLEAHFRFSQEDLERKNPKYNEAVLSHKFVLSPPGLGLDAYRTWQALYFGRVPIVGPDLPPSLYRDLPVLQVQDWGVLTPAFLERQWQQLTRQKYSTQKLTLLWWLRTILRECLLTP
eukprot:GGOE01044673.1.p1 GENE.GGOE01044673.1~~GGOE01044673.1.p1  ORF type:complete len:516 (+),score=117.18 GGOE01044673.1:116-1663(+)